MADSHPDEGACYRDGDFREPHLRDRDFLGAFAVLEHNDAILMVQNQRRIDGQLVLTWDLPGGQVEPGELVEEALVRELREETGLIVAGVPRFLFVQEGVRHQQDQRTHAWRSFFFAVAATGEPRASAEVRGVRWIARQQLGEVLTAPYHDSFRQWLQTGELWFRSEWRD